MLALMSKNWWAVAIRGIAAIAFGILTIALPGITLLTLVYLFAAFALVDGASAIVSVLRGDPATRGHGWSVLIIGIVGVIAGIGTFLWPGITALTLLYIVAFWAIVTGAFQVIAAIRLRREIQGEWLLVLSGVASIAFGALLIVSPGAGLLAVLTLVAAWAIIFGVILLALAWRLRGMQTMTGRGAMAGTM